MTCLCRRRCSKRKSQPLDIHRGMTHPAHCAPPPARALLAMLTNECRGTQDPHQLNERARVPPADDKENDDLTMAQVSTLHTSLHTPYHSRTVPPITHARPAAAAAPPPPLCLAPCTPSACCIRRAHAALLVHCIGPRSARLLSTATILGSMPACSSSYARLTMPLYPLLRCAAVVCARV